MNSNDKNTFTNKQLIDELLAKKFGHEYIQIVNGNVSDIDKCSNLVFLIQQNKIKKCRHIFVPTRYNFVNEGEPIYFCIKCGVNNRYPNNVASEEELERERTLYALYEATKDNAIYIDCFDNPQELMIFYEQIKETLVGLSDEKFIDYINNIFAHHELVDTKIKKRVR